MCRRAIFTLSLDRCSYPDDWVQVHRVPGEFSSHVPFPSVDVT